MTQAILPGAVLGVLGSGQLGRMFAVAARRLGYRIHVYSPEQNTPTGEIADLEFAASYTDEAEVRRFAQSVDAVTFEFENVLRQTVEIVAEQTPVRPSGNVLHVAQHRLREKTFLHENGFPVTPFRHISSRADIEAVDEELLPGILKTAAWGYDGKGQAAVSDRGELAAIFETDFRQDAILEQRVDFEMELSVVAARALDGSTVSYSPIENAHANHILDISVCPARVSAKVAEEAEQIAMAVLESLDVVGVMCVEFFLTRDGRLLINELAPRPHNSGHLTIDAHVTCQFEQQVRAMCGLPLGSTRQREPAAMANLLGDLWSDGAPNWSEVCDMRDVKIHLYGKREARVGRKMGHLTVTAATADEAAARAREARDRLTPPKAAQ